MFTVHLRTTLPGLETLDSDGSSVPGVTDIKGETELLVYLLADFGHQGTEDRFGEGQRSGVPLHPRPQTQLQGDAAGNRSAL